MKVSFSLILALFLVSTPAPEKKYRTPEMLNRVLQLASSRDDDQNSGHIVKLRLTAVVFCGFIAKHDDNIT